ncbi:MAG: M14 family zinc carboxypeptidase [Victivallaceae bacterium]|nr:M14 family zinc carboxypeptidase [Victivallaceae bacterium]
MRTEVIFNNMIPYGNGIFLGAESKEKYLEILVSSEARNAPESLWFCFNLQFKHRPPNRNKLRLVIKYFYNSLGVFSADSAEKINLVARPSQGLWTRLPAGRTVMLTDGRFDAVWETEIVSDRMDFAFCFPYGMPEVDELVKKSRGYLSKDIIGLSPENRNIIRLSNNYGDDNVKLPGLYLVARQHSGETSGSLALHGFLERLAEKNARNLTVWCLPLTNIDGIEKGYYGKDNFPIDLNRAWGSSPMRYENKVFQHDITLWANKAKPFLGLDFHSPGGSDDEGVYCAVLKPKKGKGDKASLEWSERFEKFIPSKYASRQFCVTANCFSRWELPCFSYNRFTSFMNKVYGIPALLFEFPYSQIRGKVLEINDYFAIGRALADAVLDFLDKAPLRNG